MAAGGQDGSKMAAGGIVVETLEKLDQQLNCSICLETFADPKLLRCGHYFCLECLEKLLVEDDRQRFILRCPTCRTPTRIPNMNVAGLQPAFHVAGLLDIRDSVKKIKETLHKDRKDAICCYEHDGNEAQLYCETCEKLICLHCVIKHRSHDCDSLINTATECLKELNDLFLLLEGLDSELRTVLNQLEAMNRTELLVDQDRLQFLEEKKNFTSNQICKVSTWSGEIAKKMESFWGFIKGGGVSNKAIIALLQAHKELKDYMQTVRRDVDQVHVPTLLDPVKCHAVGKGLYVARVGKNTTAIVNVTCFAGLPQENIVKSIECALVSVMDDSRMPCRINVVGQGQYEITYQPTIKGRHQLHVKVDHRHIRGSPFDVTVIDGATETIEFPIMTLYNVNHPIGVAINRQEQVLISEEEGQIISTFSRDGKKLRSFLPPIFIPHGITGDSDEDIVLVNINGIYKLTAEGRMKQNPLLCFGIRCIAFNASNGKFYIIHILNSDFTFFDAFTEHHIGVALACDNTGKVYVAYSLSNRIKVFTARGEFVRMFGKYGDGRGELNHPISIAVDNSRVVYVSEFGNRRISLFTSYGSFLTSFGRLGTGPGEFVCPCYLAVDSNQTLYVCDVGLSRVQAFSCKRIQYKALHSPLALGLYFFIIVIGIIISRLLYLHFY